MSRRVRLPHLPQTPRDVQRAIPASRLTYCNTGEADWWNRNGIERDQTDERVERGDMKKGREYNNLTQVISESVRPTGWVMVATELQHTGQIGSSVRPREVWDVRRWLNGCCNAATDEMN